MIGRNTIMLFIVGSCIIIGFVSQAQLSQKEDSPLYEYRTVQMAERFGLAQDGSADSNLDFGSVDTTELTIKNTQISSAMENVKRLPNRSVYKTGLGTICVSGWEGCPDGQQSSSPQGRGHNSPRQQTGQQSPTPQGGHDSPRQQTGH